MSSDREYLIQLANELAAKARVLVELDPPDHPHVMGRDQCYVCAVADAIRAYEEFRDGAE